MTDEPKLPVAVKYTPDPYWGCPNCGAIAWGILRLATYPADSAVYECRGHRVGMMSLPGCGCKFTLSPEQVEESRRELEAAGFEVAE